MTVLCFFRLYECAGFFSYNNQRTDFSFQLAEKENSSRQNHESVKSAESSTESRNDYGTESLFFRY